MAHTKERVAITCEGLQKPLPIYSHANIYNGIVYISAVQGFIPGTFTFSEHPQEQARQAIKNLRVILQQSGSDLSHVLKITVLMTNMHDFPEINVAINEAFPESPPARSSVAVVELPAGLGAKVVIEAIAAVIED